MPAFGRYPLVPIKFNKFTPGPSFVVVEELLEPEHERSGPSPLILVQQPVATHGKILASGSKVQKDHGIFPGDYVVYEQWQGGRWSFEDSSREGGQVHCLIMDIAYVGLKYIPE